MTDWPSSHLAQRLNHLFATVHPLGRGPYSNEEVASAIRAEGGDISKQYIAYLRKGERENPRLHHLEALARFFGVHAAYFFDEETADRTDPQLDRLRILRDAGMTEDALRALDTAGVNRIALRAVGSSSLALNFAEEVIDRLREMEGLPRQQEPTPEP